jgi:hypothetical protein
MNKILDRIKELADMPIDELRSIAMSGTTTRNEAIQRAKLERWTRGEMIVEALTEEFVVLKEEILS